MSKVLTSKVTQKRTALQQAPHSFSGVQLRSIGRQPHQLDAFSRTFLKKGPNLLASMNTRTIPDNAHLTLDTPKQVSQESHYAAAVERLFLGDQVQFSTKSDSSNRRQMLVAAATTLPKYRSLPTPCPSTHNMRQQIESGLVHEQDGAPLPQPLFLRVGHSSCFHRSIASPSRSLARRIGFCGVQPSLRKMCPTCVGWYVTPKRFSITRHTRSLVHTSSQYPKACGPCSSREGNCPNCSGVSLGLAPLLGRRYNPSTPPASRTRLSHWLIAPCVTPNASAIRRCDQPCWSSSQALSLRPSSQSVAPFDSRCVGSSMRAIIPLD